MVGVRVKVAINWKGAGVERAAQGAMEEVVSGVTFLTADLARGKAPVRTGFLRGSIVGEAEGMRGSVLASAPYAAYVEPRRPFLVPALYEAAALAPGLLAGAAI